MDAELALLIAGPASLGLIHTLLGPDHYLPFILPGRARRWGLARTLRLTAACGAGHVAASLVLGALGVAAATVGTMLALVAAGQLGLARLGRPGAGGRRLLAPLERYGHLAAGAVLTACGLAILAGL